MNHPERRYVTTSTPWGRADTAHTYARGIVSYSTPGHGGFHVSKTVNQRIPAPLRNSDGWYEEDCEANIPLYFLADLMPAYVNDDDRASFRKSIRSWMPHKWEEVTGETVPASDSHVIAEEEFKAAHADDFIARSAWGSWHDNVPAGFVGVCAYKGRDEKRYFLVPKTEYDTRTTFGFVIDTSRHADWKGPQ